MREIICIKSRDTSKVLYLGSNEAEAHRIACENLEQKPRKHYVTMSAVTRLFQTEQYRQALNGYDPLHWYVH